jgi:spore coat polysaccharide biosynthesis protein SpsF
MKVITIIQVRTSSSRLTNKALFCIDGKTLLEQVISQAKEIYESHELWVATTEQKEDDIIELVCKKLNLNFLRGSLNDVRSRFSSIVRLTNADIVVRLTADNPFTEPKYANQLVRFLIDNPDFDYARMNKKTILDGTGSEAFRAISFFKSIDSFSDLLSQEHVTTPFISNVGFNSADLEPENCELISHVPYFLGVDTMADFIKVSQLYPFYKNNLKQLIFKLNNHETVI